MVPLELFRGLTMPITNLTLLFDPTFGRSCVVYRGVRLWAYEIPLGIGCDSCRSQRELPEYTKIIPNCLEKSATFMGSKIVFFFFCTKKALRSIQKRNHTYVYIQLVKGYQNHPHMTLHDLPLKKNGMSKYSLFQILGILRA
jgi:hypothetical protein